MEGAAGGGAGGTGMLFGQLPIGGRAIYCTITGVPTLTRL